MSLQVHRKMCRPGRPIHLSPHGVGLVDGNVGVEVKPVPHWEKRFPGRFQYELSELAEVGVLPDVDFEALQKGQLALTLEWRLDPETVVRLRAVYPDTYPYLRPQVFLVGGLRNVPGRHVSPQERNICLLGRDTRQWLPSWTLKKLLSEQLADAIRGTGEEDPQGEPADVWWNGLGPNGSYCLVNSDWDLGDAAKGILDFQYIVHSQGSADRNEPKPPIIRGAVTEVRDDAGKVVCQWDGPLPPELTENPQTLRIPWTRPGETLFPSKDLDAQVDRLLPENFFRSKRGGSRRRSKLESYFFVVAHPVEISLGEIGLGWVFLHLYGHQDAFRQTKKTATIKISTLPVYRAGIGDLTCRVPAARALRDKRIAVVGVGALGAPVALELARNGCGTLDLLDHDRVEPGNTIRWPLGTSAWGHLKLKALSMFVSREYPWTSLKLHQHCVGRVGFGGDDRGDDQVFDDVVSHADLVIDASASYGVTTALARSCRDHNVPLISVFATPTVEGGIVALYNTDGGCPTCLEHAWEEEHIRTPPGFDNDDEMQPPGCAERTFHGADFDLQELSLQAVRLAVDVIGDESRASEVQTLSLVDSQGKRCPPMWQVDPLPKNDNCCG